MRSVASTYSGVPPAQSIVFAQRFASASNPALATVVDHARVPSAVSARQRSTRSTRPDRSSAAAADRVVAGDLEVAGEVVSRTRGHDREDAVALGGEPGELAHQAVAPARDDAAPVVECGARDAGRVGEVGRHVDLHVGVDARERVRDVWKLCTSATASRCRIDHRGPTLGQLGRSRCSHAAAELR